jgi:hypothetical protein
MTHIKNCELPEHPRAAPNTRGPDTSTHTFPASEHDDSESLAINAYARRTARAAARAARAAAREASLLSSSSTTTSDEPDAEDDDGELSIAHVHQNNPFGFPPGAPPPAAA